MALLDSEARPVPPGPPTRPSPERQTTTAQGLNQLKPGRVDRCRILEGAFGLRLHLRVAELKGRLVPFGRIAAVTGQSQIRDALHLDAPRGRPAGEPVRPGDGIANPGEQGRWQPATRNPPVVEAGRSVPQVSASAASAGVSLPDFVRMDLFAPVADFAEKDSMMDGSLLRLLHAGQRDACRLRPGIDFERQWLERSVFHTPVFEANDERLHPMHHGAAPLEQESRPFGCTGHQWMFLLI